MTTETKCEACSYWAARVRGEGDPELFEWLFGAWVFDIDRAKAILAAAPRPEVAVDMSEAGHPVHRGMIEERHLPHVDPTQPGVMATIHLVPKGCAPGLVLIDGHHRQARALADGLPFTAYVLTAAETEQILLRTPKDLAREAAERRKARAAVRRGG